MGTLFTAGMGTAQRFARHPEHKIYTITAVPEKLTVLLKRLFELSLGKYEWNFRQNGAEAAIRRGGTLKKAADFRDFCNKSHPVRLLKNESEGFSNIPLPFFRVFQRTIPHLPVYFL